MKKNKVSIWAIFFWIILWQVACMLANEPIFFVSPYVTLCTLAKLLFDSVFWQSIFSSMLKITIGFLLASFLGILFAVISYKSIFFKQLISPLVLMTKSIPVASFIILILIWFSSKELSIIISMMVVFPIIYTNILTGCYELNPKQNEMASLFRLTIFCRLRYIYFPQILPFFSSAATISLGLAFKSGIAAEVIGMPDKSIGEQLFQAKIFLDTPTLFAWTFVILLLSFIFEKALLFIIKYITKKSTSFNFVKLER